MFLQVFVFAVSLNCAVAANQDTLELIQVFIRHGNRSALEAIPGYQTWYLDTFSPFENAQLTPPGRRQMFEVGTYFRQRYNDFLPDEYSYSDVLVRCSSTTRVVESAAVAMTAIFPPKDKQIWEDTQLGKDYTPIPCEYVPEDQDIVFTPENTDCPRYNYLVNGYLNSNYFVDKYNELTLNGSVNKYIALSLNLSTSLDVYGLRDTWENLMAMQDYKITLPSWSPPVYPHPLSDIMTYSFMGVYYDTEIVRLSAGELLKELTETASLLENNQLFPKSRKLIAYFGHDKTIYALLVALGLQTSPPLCDYGSSVIMELHRNHTTSEIGYKFLFRNGTQDAVVYTVPGCSEICPLSYVKQRLQPYIPVKPYYVYCNSENP